MNEAVENLNTLLDSYVESISKTDKVFSDSLKKWKHHIIKVSLKNSKQMKMDPEDFFQEIMTHLVESNSRYNFKHYRYQGRLYEVVMIDGPYAYLSSNPFNRKEMRKVLVDREEVEEVRKGLHSSFIYQRINQFTHEYVTSYFTKKNGFSFKTERKVVKIRSEEKTKYREKDIKVPVRRFSLESDIDFDTNSVSSIYSRIPTPEDFLIAEEMYENAREGLCPDGRLALDKAIQNSCGLKKPRSKKGREVLRHFANQGLDRKPVQFEELL
jgi:hypothetical protein